MYRPLATSMLDSQPPGWRCTTKPRSGCTGPPQNTIASSARPWYSSSICSIISLSLRSVGRLMTRPIAPSSLCSQSRETVCVKFSSSRRSEEHTSELQSLMRISYAVFCLKKKTTTNTRQTATHHNTSAHSTDSTEHTQAAPHPPPTQTPPHHL